MKKFVLTALCALVSVSAFAQGTIQLSNIGKGIVTYEGGEAAGPETSVQFTSADGATLLGDAASVLGAGFFSAGSKTLAGLEGEQTLRVLATSDKDGLDWSGLSAPFTVTLGGAGTPPSPAAAIPGDFSGVVMTAVPEPSTIALAILGGAALFFRRRK